MELSGLRTGTKLEIEIFDQFGDKAEPTLVSQVEWIEGDNTAVIAAPIVRGNVISIPADTVINVYFVGMERGTYNLYKFNAEVRGMDISNNLYVLRIETRSMIERVQRRRYFRLDCYVEVRYKLVESLDDNSDYKKTIAKNLSGGGICMKINEKIKPGSILACEMSFESNKEVRFYGKVVRFEETGNESRYRYEAGVAYIDIDERDREAIIRYIFNEQRKLLSKGLVY
ncbi:MAG: flagellar brake protein [Bacillota bacterium]